MAQIKTSNFLPEVFKTDNNKKFLNATLDQLVTQPDLRNVNAYVGRKFTPTFKSTDNYQPEPTKLRQSYQLEPSVVVKNKTTGETEFFSSYIDLLNQVSHSGGLTDNQDRLFSSESYSFDGLFEFDKFVNFNQYYWLENGPDSVDVYGAEVPTTETFTVTRNPSNGSYMFSTAGGVDNPTVKLAYGGTYKFVVNQTGYPFYIQSNPGTSGVIDNQSNLSSRDVLGVENNGIDVGTVTFKVPLPSAQDYYVRMELAGTVDLATGLHYNQIHGKTLSSIITLSESGIDGVTSAILLQLKSLVFVDNQLEESYWTIDSTTVDLSKRLNAWRISLSDDADPVVTLNPLEQAFTVIEKQKVFIKGGLTRAEHTYYLETDYLLLNKYNLMPHITAPLTNLYYQDGVDSPYVGQIDLVQVSNISFDAAADIIGKKTYKSPNGVTFTNGLKIKFDSSVTPVSYQNNTYYVDGVGKNIRLINVDSFVTPEVDDVASQDYITINRASLDLNPWTRSNRWFHIDVINTTASYNKKIALLDQNLRASRPIIEFEADLQLFNFGRVAKNPVDLFSNDGTITDALTQVELQAEGYSINGVTLTEGMRVVFPDDVDPTVRGKIFVVNIVYLYLYAENRINLAPAEDAEIEQYNNLVVLQGPNKGKEFHYNGTAWIESQTKPGLNSTPLFDVFDTNGISLGDYTNSTFAGTKIFSYTPGAGANDLVLGFPLSYRNFNQIGDIQFTNNFDTDVFSYDNGTDVNINTLGTLQQNTSLTSYGLRNIWTTHTEQSKQFQIIGAVYDGNNPYFKIDITKNMEFTVPYFRVFKNNQATSGYEVVTIGIVKYVYITDSTLTTGDQIDILVYSDTVSKIGYYDVPKNLDFNSKNDNFSTLTLGQLRNHVTTMVGNSFQIDGTVPGNSNLRDVQIKAQGGSILQHASPLLYSSLFLIDKDANFIKGLNLARHEYTKIKNKILELSARTKGLDYTNIPVLLDTLLKTINNVKNKTFAWYHSDMVPYGDTKNTITYTVRSEEIIDYQISNIFSDTTLSNIAVLVYLNNVQLVKDADYQFDTNRSGVTILTPLTIGDTITFYEYSNTDANYIPETPTKLGLYPKFLPAKLYDTTYQKPSYVIQGHDGSLTPAFGDYRDDLLLEFEKRIYNNIKIDPAKNVLNIYDFMPGKFRSTTYTKAEFTQLLTNGFLQWAGNNRVDYITNNYFVSSEPFTWNYGKFKDSINDELLPGYWRGIYKYFYDTDRPHTHPWEMLGFSEQPSWWETRYGPAPYTGGNLVLWEDLSQGYIYGEDRYDTRFVRTGLLDIIPVDETGVLRSPEKFAVKSFNSNAASGDYKIGDIAPVEAAWRRSSDYPFAIQQAIALSQPAFYFGALINIGRYYKNKDLNQFVLSDTLQRITPAAVGVNGTVRNSVTVRAAGYINWVAEYLRDIGIDPGVKLYEYFDNVNCQLAYKMAGYTDQTFINVIAEQSSPASTNAGVIVPNESYSIELYKSTPIKTITYSGVIIERSDNGYTVSGFDTNTPYFTIIPSLANNNTYAITSLNDRAVIYKDYQKYKVTIPYGFEFTSKQQVVDFLVSYQRFLKGSGMVFTDFDPDLGKQRDFLLSATEFLTWSQQGWETSSVIVLSPILNALTLITKTGVVDKIQNYPTQSCVLDTGYNFIKYNQLTVSRSSNTNGNRFTVTALGGQTISLVKLEVVEYEHVMVFDNKTTFNDIIYAPELGNRQYRLKLVGKKTGSWTGDLNPPGFVYNNNKIDIWQPDTDYALGSLVSYKNNNYTAIQDVIAATTFNPNYWAQLGNNEIKTGLLPNFSYNAEKFNRFNDIDNPEVLGDFHLYSGSAIGFQPRSYLTNFGVDEVTQAKFYQGFIREKGTMNAVKAFTAAGFNGITSQVNLYEEWAMRVGEYGALDNNQYAEVILTEGTFNGDPTTLTLLPNNGSSTTGIIGVQPSQLYKNSDNYIPNIYENRDAGSYYENDIQTAGYVNIGDVKTTIFDISNYSQLTANLSTIGTGHTIWCAKDSTSDWNVYRMTETNNSVIQVSAAVDNIGTVITDSPHGFAYGDLVAIKGFDIRVDGFYQVYSVNNDYSFGIVLTGTVAEQVKTAGAITGVGALLYAQSVRIKSTTDISTITPPHGWINNDKLWVDNDLDTDGWAVYNKSTPWSGNVSLDNPSMKLWANTYVSGVGFGTVTAINAAGTFAVASMPTNGMGNVVVFVANVTNGNVLTQVANIGAPVGNSVTKFGASLDTAGNLLYVGSPGNSSTEYGRVHIYQFNGNATFTRTQTLTSPWSSNTGDAYGTSVSASADGAWLFVSAPEKGNVYVYHANTTSYYSYANTITAGSAAYDKFGYKVKSTSDASQVVISAPYQTVDSKTAAGAVYIYDRSIETFIANGNVYLTQYPITTSTLRVTLNGNVLTSGFTSNANAVVFTSTPTIGSVVTIDTNKIQLLEQLTSPTPSSGGAFGVTTHISGNDADIYVASPGYSSAGYYSGVVYRFVNQGASYGTITGNAIITPVATAGDSIRINGIKVTFTGTNATVISQNINSASIPGVVATVEDTGALTITSNVTTPYQKLVITPGPGSATTLTNLGLSVYANVQAILHPFDHDVSQFGSQVTSSSDGKTLLITAVGGGTYNGVTFDTVETLFDNDSTTFADTIEGSGAVYVYGLVNGSFSSVSQDQYVLVQLLENKSVSTNDQFGYSIAMNANTILVGAPGDSNTLTQNAKSEAYEGIPSAGTYYTYQNFSSNIGWDIVRQEQARVDIDSISNFYLYNANTKVISVHLDYIDPAKGKILGAAQQDLDYITAYDPAIYNTVGGIDGTPNLANSLDYHWGPAQVTKTWWNIDAIRYLDYEQGNVVYRANNWGRLFPGSTVQVCEWVESDMPPSAYNGLGTALYSDNSAYVVETNVNPNTNLITSKYYYWVTGKTSLEPNSTHKSTISTIADVIANPQAQAIPYAAVVRDDTISLYGVNEYLSGNSTVLHMDYDTLKNSHTIHAEYQLVQEGNSGSKIPTRIIEKLKDSLCGLDVHGNPVTELDGNGNYVLPVQRRIGLDYGQTLFVDKQQALRNFVEYVNGVFKLHPIVSEFNISQLYSEEALPSELNYDLQVETHAELSYLNTSTLASGYVVLVVHDETKQQLWTTYTWSGTAWALTSTQSYYTPFYWSKIDWYDTTYDSTVLPTYFVNTVTEIPTLTVAIGDTIKVLNNGNNQFVVYRVNESGTTDLVGIQNGTIQLNSNIYTSTTAKKEIRIIFEAIENYIFVDTLAENFNNLFFFLINYILTEQPAVDWIFKTSFVSILHKLRKLSQPANYIPDNQTYYESYINEVKPYRTSIREYLIDYEGNDEYNADVSDFDIPATYISSVGAYRSPNGYLASDATSLSTLPQYSQWYNYHSYGINEVLVANVGTGYASYGANLTPTVTIVGGGGTGANVIARVDFASNSISRFEVIDPGTGYTSQPTVFINGTGTGAVGYVKLKNHYQIDSLLTTTLTANANVTMYVGNIITQPNTGATGTVYSASTGNVVTLTGVTGTFASNQYIYSDLANLNTFVTSTTYLPPQFVNKSYNTVRNITTTLLFDRTSYTSNITAWQPNITVTANSWISYNNAAYKAISNVYSSATLTLSSNVTANVGDYVTQETINGNSRVLAISSNLQLITVGNITGSYKRRGGNVSINGATTGARPIQVSNIFDYTKYEVLPDTTFESAADRITAYYQPTADMPSKDLTQLMDGAGYPGVTVTGVKFDATTLVTNSNVIGAFNANSTLVSGNVSLLDFSLLNYSIGQPLTLVNNDDSSVYRLTIADITQSNLFVSGLTDNISNGANVTLKYYDYTNPTYLDSAIQNTYITDFGTGSSDVSIDGGSYYDTYSSHAPEELVPGIVYDSLNMVVSTKIQNNSAIMTYRVVHNMNANAASTNTKLWPKYYGVSTAHTTTLSADLRITDSNIHVRDASKLSGPNASTLTPGIIYINGEKIIFWTVDVVNNVLGQIRRAVDGTGAPTVHASSSSVVDCNLTEVIPGGNVVHTTTWLNLPVGAANAIVDTYGISLADNFGNVLTTTGATIGAVTDGLGLENSTSEQAVFIKNLQ
jgi:hypothetical protein